MLCFTKDLSLLPTSPLTFLIFFFFFFTLALLWKLVDLKFISGDRFKRLNSVPIFDALSGNPVRFLFLLTEFKPHHCCDC